MIKSCDCGCCRSRNKFSLTEINIDDLCNPTTPKPAQSVDEEILSAGEWLKMHLEMPSKLYGGMTAIEFAEKVGWIEVYGMFSRMYGAAPYPSDRDKLTRLEAENKILREILESAIDVIHGEYCGTGDHHDVCKTYRTALESADRIRGVKNE